MYSLKEYLFYKNMSVTEFCKIAGLDRTFVSSIITGGRRPSAKSLIAIEKATKGKVTPKTICKPIRLPDDWEVEEEGGKAA
jgi:DNA-binding transcriptional regulator YdaS (Cro superfamily)